MYKLIWSISLVFAISSCSKVPKHVISPDDMAEVLADMYIAETLVENNYRQFIDDSVKMLLKQSILAKHGYTVTDLDTSFVWYGGNLAIYNDVCDETIKIIENKMAERGEQARRELTAMDGDSINIWDKPAFLIIKNTSPSGYLSYSYDSDSLWQKGDIFTLRAKFNNVSGNPSWTISADYDDGTFETLNSRINEGWYELTFYGDSLRNASRIFGAINFDVKHGVMIVDSLQLIHKKLNAQRYPQRYRQRLYDLSKKSDTLTVQVAQ